MDYWLPNADRRIPRMILKAYKIVAIASVIYLAVGAVLYKLNVI
jgi:hypothetical protein